MQIARLPLEDWNPKLVTFTSHLKATNIQYLWQSAPTLLFMSSALITLVHSLLSLQVPQCRWSTIHPWSCTKKFFLILALLIPGPMSATKQYNCILAPLIEDNRTLWVGVEAFDIRKGVGERTFLLSCVGPDLWANSKTIQRVHYVWATYIM